MVTNEENIFQKTWERKTRIRKTWGVGPPRFKLGGMTKCHSALSPTKAHLHCFAFSYTF